jgi:hypothetical protein
MSEPPTCRRPSSPHLGRVGRNDLEFGALDSELDPSFPAGHGAPPPLSLFLIGPIEGEAARPSIL